MNDKKDKDDPVIHWGDTDFGSCVGVACILLAFFLGIGGCCALGGSFQMKLKDEPTEAAK